MIAIVRVEPLFFSAVTLSLSLSLYIYIYIYKSTGAKHAHVICDICRVQPIRGIRWKCQRCYDFDLCSQCYHAGKHNTNHEFWCIDVEDGARQAL